MNKATRLLRDRVRKLLEAANSVGYDSDAAFNRAFKRMHGVSAGEYGERTQPDSEALLAGEKRLLQPMQVERGSAVFSLDALQDEHANPTDIGATREYG